MSDHQTTTTLTLTSEDWAYLSGVSYVSTKYKLHYVPTPKVACTALKWWFVRLEGIDFSAYDTVKSWETDPDLVIHDCFHHISPSVTGLDKRALKEVLESNEFFRFAVVRNPFNRIFSAWQSKLLLREPLQIKPYVAADFFNRNIRSSKDIASAFEGFLEYLNTEGSPNIADLHWTPQVEVLRIAKIKYSKISKIEEVEGLWQSIAAHLAKRGSSLPAILRSNESLLPFSSTFVSERSLELIRELYNADFLEFGYSRDRPATDSRFDDGSAEVAIRAIGIIRARHQRFSEVRNVLEKESLALANSMASLESINRAVSERERELVKSRAWIDELRTIVAGKDAALSEQTATIKGIREDFAQQERNIGELRALLAAKDAALSEQTATIEAMRASTSWRLTAPLRRMKFRCRQLGNTLKRRLFSPKVYKYLRYLGGLALLPGRVKLTIRPLFRNVRLTRRAAQAPHIEPYVVRIPQASRKVRPRVLYALGNFMTGGSSRLVVDLVEHLGHEYDQQVLTSYVPPSEHYTGVQITELGQGATVGEVAAFIRRVAPDLLHVHYWGDCDEPWYDIVFRAADAVGVRVIENVNTPVMPYRSESVRCYIFVSDYVQKVFGGGLEAKSQRIYPGSDFELFSRRSRSVPSDDCIGMVYRLEKDKLNQASIEPFIKTVQRRAKTRALIVGGGYLLECFRAAVEDAGIASAFTFTGYVPYRHLPALFDRMSVFVAPLWKESFGQVGPFAMSMEIPVVGYDIGAIPEIIGDPRLCAPAGDSDRLAEIITQLLENRAWRMEIGIRNRERARALFSVQVMIDAYRRVYSQALETRG